MDVCNSYLINSGKEINLFNKSFFIKSKVLFDKKTFDDFDDDIDDYEDYGRNRRKYHDEDEDDFYDNDGFPIEKHFDDEFEYEDVEDGFDDY